jgi:transposase
MIEIDKFVEKIGKMRYSGLTGPEGRRQTDAPVEEHGAEALERTSIARLVTVGRRKRKRGRRLGRTSNRSTVNHNTRLSAPGLYFTVRREKMQESETRRRFVGIDLGKKGWTMAVIGPNGKTVTCAGNTTVFGREELCKKLKATDKVALEAGNMAFLLAKEIMAKAGSEVVVLNPARLNLIYLDTKKTDKIDAIKLAQILEDTRDERLPRVPVPSDEEMARRRLLSEYRREKQARASAVHRLHALFHQAGITTVVKKDLASKDNRDQTVALLAGDTAEEAASVCAHIDLYEARIKTLHARIEKQCRENEDIKLLETIPGVGPVVAFAFYSYIGDADRFANSAQVSNYLGIIPRVSQSGQTCHYGRITRRGNGYLRSLLVQAAWVAVTRTKAPNLFRRKYEDLLANGKNKKRAITAIARKIGGLMWTLLRTQSGFEYRKYVPPKKPKTVAEQILEELKAA